MFDLNAGQRALEKIALKSGDMEYRDTIAGKRDVSYLVFMRGKIEHQYRNTEQVKNTGGSFGEILCGEIHTNGLTFVQLAEKWSISVTLLGELIWDHCKRMEMIEVNHDYDKDNF